MLKPVTVEDLESWELKMDDSNLHVQVPDMYLDKVFDTEEKEIIAGRGTLNKDSISYLTQQKSIAVRSLNNAYAWAQVLKLSDFQGTHVVELGPGTSPVIDLALAFSDFKGTLTKIDYTEWVDENATLRRPFTVVPLALDIVKNSDQIPQSDLIAMNHFWDDLYMGLWAADEKVDFFGKAFSEIESNTAAWQSAMSKKDLYYPRIADLVTSLSKRVTKGGMVIMRNHISGYETHFRQVDRVNFTFALTNFVAEQFMSAGFIEVPINFEALQGAAGSNYPGSFFVLKNATL